MTQTKKATEKTMRAIALLKLTVPVIGVVAAVENMPDGKATRPPGNVRGAASDAQETRLVGA